MVKRTLYPTRIQSICDPYVIILNSPSERTKRWSEIWNRSAYNVCADGAANKLMCVVKKHEWKLPNIIVGDFDSISDESRKFFAMKNVRLIEEIDQNAADIKKSLRQLVKNTNIWDSEQYLIILGGLCGRLDHTFQTVSTLLQFYNEYLHMKNVFVLDGCNLITILREGETELDFSDRPDILTKVCGVIPISLRKTVVSSMGLEYDMDNLELAFGSIISSSNSIVRDKITIKTSEPVLFTMEIIERATSKET